MKKSFLLFTIILVSFFSQAQCITNFKSDTVSTAAGGAINISFSDDQNVGHTIYVGGCNVVTLLPGKTTYSILTNAFPCSVRWLTLGGVTYKTTYIAITSLRTTDPANYCQSVFTGVPVPSNYLYLHYPACSAVTIAGAQYADATSQYFVGWNVNADPSTWYDVTYSVDNGATVTAMPTNAFNYGIPAQVGQKITYRVNSHCQNGTVLSTKDSTITVVSSINPPVAVFKKKGK